MLGTRKHSIVCNKVQCTDNSTSVSWQMWVFAADRCRSVLSDVPQVCVPSAWNGNKTIVLIPPTSMDFRCTLRLSLVVPAKVRCAVGHRLPLLRVLISFGVSVYTNRELNNTTGHRPPTGKAVTLTVSQLCCCNCESCWYGSWLSVRRGMSGLDWPSLRSWHLWTQFMFCFARVMVDFVSIFEQVTLLVACQLMDCLIGWIKICACAKLSIKPWRRMRNCR